MRIVAFFAATKTVNLTKNIRFQDKSSAKCGPDLAQPVSNESLPDSSSKSLARHVKPLNLVLGAKLMPLFQDRVDGEYYLFDGDSLLMEAMDTCGWQFGQQLHLFYSAESILKLLKDHGGDCQVMYFHNDIDIWQADPLLSLFRRAMQLHLVANCSVPVHTNLAKSFLDQAWLDYLDEEKPLFFMLHDGFGHGSLAKQRHIPLTLSSLACRVPVAYSSTLHQSDMKLHAQYLQWSPLYEGVFRKVREMQLSAGDQLDDSDDSSDENDSDNLEASNKEVASNAQQDKVEKLSKKMKNTEISDSAKPISQLKDYLAIRIGVQTISSSSSTSESIELASRWCLYFACMSSLTLDDRLQLVAKFRNENPSVASDKTDEKNAPKKPDWLASIYNLAECLLEELTSLASLNEFADPESVADLVDVFVYRQFGQFWTGKLPSGHPRAQQILSRYESYANKISTALKTADGSNETEAFAALLPLTISTELQPEPVIQPSSIEKAQLRRIDNRLLKEFAGGMLDQLSSSNSVSITTGDEANASATSAMLFDERYHWHVNKELRDDLDEKAEPELSKNPVIRKRQLKNIQIYKNYINMYGESLHNETSETIVLSAGDTASASAASSATAAGDRPKSSNQHNKKNSDEQKQQNNSKQKQQQQSKGKAKPLSKSEAIKEQNLRAKADKEMAKLKEQWKNLLPGFKQLEPRQAIAEAIRFTESCTVQDQIFEEPLLFVMQQQYKVWKASCLGSSGRSFAALAELVQTLHKYTTEPLASLISSDFRIKIAEFFVMIGFKEAAIVSSVPADRLKRVQVEKECVCPLNYRDFQMQHMGHLMQRNVRFDPDPRVKGFIPDTWQRELLDVVDRRESAVIVAPTSSGKTFCSYYCMKKVLEMSDEAIAVYVAPTKALVNQVQASITARFSKPNLTPGMELCGVFTRDYTHKATSCQILVTVPQCLELLLLSPRRQGWASRIRYVIFDEVHCIGTGIGGVVWEYLLCMIRCPFLALSATISNKDYFHDWLQTVKQFVQGQDSAAKTTQQPLQQQLSKKRQKAIAGSSASVAIEGYKVNLVTYSERYSDIRTSVYLPGDGSIVEVNPCSFLNDRILRINGFPKNLKLSPKESNLVLSAALKCFNEDQSAVKALEKFKPEAFFGTEPITRTQFRELEIGLKSTLSELLRQRPPSKSAQLLSTIRSLEDQQDCTKQFAVLSDVDLVENFPDLIDRLRAEGRLPAVVFMNARQGIEDLIRALVKRTLERIEATVDKSLLERIERSREAMATAARRNRDKDESDEDESLAAEFESYYRDQLEYRSKIHSCAYFKPQAVTDSFLNKVLDRVTDEEAKQMLQLGVCYHHAGCSTKHRQSVEMLFRSGYLQVVTATGTLALGIHMPCKTVIFAGDDKFLDALNYHQMAGRSGRRGFDNIGNVVFYGVPASKIAHLIQADLPELKGGFPLTCAFVLRLLLLTGNATDPEAAHAKAATVLEHPFAAHNKPDMIQQLRLFFLFSVQFLHRQDLINEAGVPLDLAGLVCHMGYHQPGNFVLTYLLRSPALRELCQSASQSLPPVHYGFYCDGCQTCEAIVGDRYKCTKCWSDYSLCASCYRGRCNHARGREQHTKQDFELQKPPLRVRFSDKTMRELVLIVCHLFTNLELHRSLVTKTDRGGLAFRWPTENSKVLLRSLPSAVKAVVKDYNIETAHIYTNYLRCIAQSGLIKFSTKLPFSNSSPVLASPDNGANQPEQSVVAPLARLSWGPTGSASNRAVKRVLLNTSGTVAFNTEQLRRLVPLEILTDASLIPILPIGRLLNAYALDFFIHGSLPSLDRDNGVREGDQYGLLLDFTLACRAVANLLDQLAADPNSDVVCAFKQLAFECQEKFRAAFPGAKGF